MHERRSNRMTAAPRQRGIAIVAVLLIVALAAVLAASVMWRQQVATRDVENQRLAVETMWAQRAAVEWARALLRAQSKTASVTHTGQAWAAPVSDVQLVTFMPREAVAVNSELSRAWISGQVEDAQSRFNVMNLVSRIAPGKPWQANSDGVLAYRRLLGELSISPALAQQTADYILSSLRETNSGEGWPLQLVSLDDLSRIPGYDAQTIETLKPFVTILPDFTTVNANTAAEQVLVAAIPSLSATQATRLVERRNKAYFVSPGDIATIAWPTEGSDNLPDGSIVGVNSGYFIVHCRVHSPRINVRIDTLIARYGIGNYSWTQVIWAHRLVD
jgi:general secretion pathway protein K